MRQELCRAASMLAFCLLTLFCVVGTARAEGYYDPPTGARIDNIQVVGTQRIEPATVLTYLDVKVGDNMTEDTLNRALKSLFGTGLFADVTLRQKGTTLEVNVTENPVINQIAFEGNDRIKDDDLLAEIQLRPRQVFTRSKVQEDVNRLYALYRRQGRFSVTIDPKVIRLDQNRVNLVFEISEGPVTKIASIRFVGNVHYTDEKLRTVISTKDLLGFDSFQPTIVMIRNACRTIKNYCVNITSRKAMPISKSLHPLRSYQKIVSVSM